ncbi:TPA: winged helix-turn-helix domain-containing protein [Salmonella enterica]|nr:winged helix-turn-helix domain-containing protein [Salmonella enterica]
MHWIINRYIVFLPDNKKLVSLNNQEVEVVLTAPASRCLLLLLESCPDIVTQRQFYKTVWEDDGIIVPANTLYQNISIVRRGLRAVGQTEVSVVNTIPRKGFQIDKDVEITCVDSEFSIIDASQSTSDVTRNDIGNETDVSSTEKCLVVKSQPGKQEKENVLTSYDLRTICLILLAFFFGAAGGRYLWNVDSTKNFYADYKLVDKDKGYNFFIKDETHNEQSDFNHFKRLLLSSGLSYKKYPWVYFPLSTTSPGLSMLACSRKYTNTSPMQCITLSFRETNNE